uniref:Rab-interacting lysosomal protein n=1 Tax=Cavia porcellus TaxID=10141 RepID=H0VGR1_CAVPO
MEPRRVTPGKPCRGPRVATGSRTAAELVYHLAGALGTELQELARRFGPEAAAGLVPLVVRALELLEQAAVGPAPDSVSDFPRSSRAGPLDSKPASWPPQLQVSAQQAEVELRRLREENEHLRREARAGPSPWFRPQLQEQLQRLLLVNAELRHKLAAVQAQLRAAQDREREHELPREGARERAEGEKQQPNPASPEDLVDALGQPGRPVEAGQCGFSREELEQILQERNELKAKVFLLKEELAYFQRELLTDHRVPGLLLEAMKVAVKKQRKKIKAKMLGTPEEAESSDDEDGSWPLLSKNKEDDSPPPESRVQSFFGLWCRSEAEAPRAETGSTSPSERGGEEEAPQQPHVEPVGTPQAPNS